MKVLIFTAMILAGSVHLARADDDSCATDNECIKAKVEAGYSQFQRQEAKKHKKDKLKQKKRDADDHYVSCAEDDDCQRTKLDAIDHANGENVDD